MHLSEEKDKRIKAESDLNSLRDELEVLIESKFKAEEVNKKHQTKNKK
jgi:hypothetical protein